MLAQAINVIFTLATICFIFWMLMPKQQQISGDIITKKERIKKLSKIGESSG